jgi:hypothetical protein
MLALIFAVVSLTSIDPDPVATPAAQIGQHLPSSTGFAPGGMPQSGLTPGFDVTGACPFQSQGIGPTFETDGLPQDVNPPVIGPSFGAPSFGPSLFPEPGGFGQTLADPACGSSASASPLSFDAPAGFGSPFGNGSPYGFVSPFGYSSVWSPTIGSRIVRLDPGALRSATAGSIRLQAMLGDRFNAEPGAEFRSFSGVGGRNAERYELRTMPGMEAVTLRRH